MHDSTLDLEMLTLMLRFLQRFIQSRQRSLKLAVPILGASFVCHFRRVELSINDTVFFFILGILEAGTIGDLGLLRFVLGRFESLSLCTGGVNDCG